MSVAVSGQAPEPLAGVSVAGAAASAVASQWRDARWACPSQRARDSVPSSTDGHLTGAAWRARVCQPSPPSRCWDRLPVARAAVQRLPAVDAPEIRLARRPATLPAPRGAVQRRARGVHRADWLLGRLASPASAGHPAMLLAGATYRVYQRRDRPTCTSLAHRLRQAPTSSPRADAQRGDRVYTVLRSSDRSHPTVARRRAGSD